MRCVDRGSEPAGLDEYRREYTHLFVSHVQNKMGQPHPDMKPYWLEFISDLADRFNDKCGYCERLCDAHSGAPKSITVDHFKPRSILEFADLALVWENWVLSCYDCNQRKDNKWPESGYVDPCPADPDDCPEKYLEVDPLTGSLLAKKTLASRADKRKAQYTIDDMGLNELSKLYYRLLWINEFMADLGKTPTSKGRQEVIERYTAPDQEYAGVISILVNQMRHAGVI